MTMPAQTLLWGHEMSTSSIDSLPDSSLVGTTAGLGWPTTCGSQLAAGAAGASVAAGAAQLAERHMYSKGLGPKPFPFRYRLPLVAAATDALVVTYSKACGLR